MQTVRLALDWTPNTIHSGLYVALRDGLYKEAGLDVQLLPPDTTYTTTPAKVLKADEADLCICPSESIIAYAEAARSDFQLEAIYAILQKDASAIVAIDGGIGRMRDLQNRRYGSYNARYEDHIVRAMIEADGGNGTNLHIEQAKSKLSLFDELKEGHVDATWVFLPWEGVEAESEGHTLKIFRTEDYGVPYGYSPVIARNLARSPSAEVLAKFVQATRKGYEIVRQDPAKGAEAIRKMCVPERSEDFLLKSQKSINEYYSDGNDLGFMQHQKWTAFLNWLSEKKLLLTQKLQVEKLFTNEFQ